MPRTYEIEAEDEEYEDVPRGVQEEPDAPVLRGRPVVNTSRYADALAWEDDEDEDEDEDDDDEYDDDDDDDE